MQDTKPVFDQWAILEIMGHQTYAGRVTEQTVGGSSFVRIDVPAVEKLQAFTKLFGAASIYCITPVTEEVAVARAASLKQQPLSVYDLPDEIRSAVYKVRELAAISAPGSDELEYSDEHDEYDMPQ